MHTVHRGLTLGLTIVWDLERKQKMWSEEETPEQVSLFGQTPSWGPEQSRRAHLGLLPGAPQGAA